MKKAYYTLALVAAMALAPVGAAAQTKGQHVVTAGETVYSIARAYGVSAKDILALNPGVGDNLHPGDKLQLPQTGALPGMGHKAMYKVQRKDNLYQIALKYGLKVDELLAANPDIKDGAKLKKGTMLVIPYSATEKAQMKAAQEKAAREQAEAKRRKYISMPHPMSEIKAAVILPFKDGDARAKRMLEFYSGMLVAVDSIKGQGTNVEVFAYHSGTTADDIKAIVSKPELAKMDVIFGPLDLPQAQPLSDFCLKNKIRLVLPFATTDMVGKDNPLAYIATDDQEAVQRRAAKMVVAEMGDANYVFVNCQNSDERGRLFTSAMMRSVQGTSNSLHNVSMTDPAATIAAAFSTTKRNVVVINSIRETNLKRLATLMSKSLTENPEMRISVLGYPDWLTFTGESKQLMHQYDAHVYTTFYYDKQADNVQRVDARYKKKFNKLLANSVPCFGYLGFDIGYYVLNGMAKWGDSFEYNQKKQKHNALQHSFTFERDNEKQGFVNHNTRLVHFKPNNQVELK